MAGFGSSRNIRWRSRAATTEASRVAINLPVHACHRQIPRRNPAVQMSLASRKATAFSALTSDRLPHRRFEAWSAFTTRCGLHARWIPKDPFLEVLRRSRCLLPPPPVLPAGATEAGWEFHPLKIAAFHGTCQRAKCGAERNITGLIVPNSRFYFLATVKLGYELQQHGSAVFSQGVEGCSVAPDQIS